MKTMLRCGGLLAAAGCLGLSACGSAITTEGSRSGSSQGATTGAATDTAGSATDLSTTSGATTFDETGTTAFTSAATEPTATSGPITATTWGTTDGWGSSWGGTWGTWGSATDSGGVSDPWDCGFLGPDECERYGGADFQCVVRTGYQLQSAANCSFETYTDLCIAISVPVADACTPSPSCPMAGSATTWVGDIDFEPTVLVQQGCETYPAFDNCIAGSPDPHCACACAAGIGSSGM